MFGFIKNWFKPKDFTEVKKEYKQVKINYTAKFEELEHKSKTNEALSYIIDLCHSGLRPNQKDCPALIIHNYKKLLVIGDGISLAEATDYIRSCLSESQLQDFIHKVKQAKEYKDWLTKKKIKEIEKDF